MISVTGGLIDSRHTDIEIAMEFIHGVTEIAPVYYVTGNHEARTEECAGLVEQLEQVGVVILNDESIKIEYGNDAIDLWA